MMAAKSSGGSRRYDVHCHLDFAENPRTLADELDERGITCLSVTVTPEGYERAAVELAACGNVRVGLGLHPWWVAEGARGVEQCEHFEKLLGGTRFVGEVGLDFGARHVATRAAQVATFERIVANCATQGGKVLSIHAVQAADAVLEILERSRAMVNNTCIFHWFSGTSDELQRAIKLGCYFSVGERMLATKRGRAYVQAIPHKRLLLETDLPPEAARTDAGAQMDRSLHAAFSLLENLRGEDAVAHIAHTSAQLLSDS